MSTPILGPLGMRAVVDSFAEDPEQGIHALRVEEQPPPEPATLGPTDVVIYVRRAAVGWVDLLMLSGQYQHQTPLPYTPGLEYSGVVAWAGPQVDPSQLAVGDRVMSDGMSTGPRSKGAHRAWGGFASWAVAPANGLRRLPSGFSFDQGCNFLGNYETAYHTLIARGRVAEGELVLVLGATGATGLAAVHLAKLQGATVIAVGRSAEKLAVVGQQGADHVICSANSDGSPGLRSFRDEVKSVTGGRGVQVVYDPVGGELSAEALRCTAFGARYLIVGWAATPLVADGGGRRGAPRANQLPTNLIMMKSLDVLGCPTVIATHHDPSIRAERLARLDRWVEQGRLQPLVSRSYPFAELKEALMAKWRSEAVGGITLRISEEAPESA